MTDLSEFIFKRPPRPKQAIALMKCADAKIFALQMDQRTGKSKVVLDKVARHYRRGEVDALLVVALPAGVEMNWLLDEIPADLPDDVPRRTLHWQAKRAKTKSFAAELEALMKFAGLAVVAVNGEAIITTAFRKWLPKFIKARKLMVVGDECFVAGTLVETVDGPRPIETIQPGFLVLTSLGWRRVTSVFEGFNTELVEVTLVDGKRILCTKNHPFFTEVGWCLAKNLSGKTVWPVGAMRALRKDIPTDTLDTSTTLLRVLLRSEMEDQSTGDTRQNIYGGNRSQNICRAQGETLMERASSSSGDARQASVEQGDSDAHGVADQIKLDVKGHAPCAESSWWEWAWTDYTASCASDPAWDTLADGASHKIGRKAAWISNLLQGRLGELKEKSRDRDRWAKPYVDLIEAARSEEGRQTSGIRVARVTHIESASPISVYNLEVKGCPHYYAGGVLVHNSTLIMKTPGKKRTRVMHAIGERVKWKMILDGTMHGENPLDLWAQYKFLDWRIIGHRTFSVYRSAVAIVETKTVRHPNPAKAAAGMLLEYPSITGFNDGAIAAVRTAIAPYTFRAKRDSVEKTYAKRRFDLTDSQRSIYDGLRDEYEAELRSGARVTAAMVLTRYLRLQQIASNFWPAREEWRYCAECEGDGCPSCEGLGASPFEVAAERIDSARNPRLDALDEEWRLSKPVAIVWARFHIDVDDAMGLARDHKRRPVRFDGRDSPEEKLRARRGFQAGDFDLLVGSPRAGGRGLRLTAATTLYYYSNYFGLLTRLQSEDRAEDEDRKLSTDVVDFLANDTVDDRIVDALRAGKRLSEVVLNETAGRFL